jgi:PEP-CTERM motif
MFFSIRGTLAVPKLFAALTLLGLVALPNTVCAQTIVAPGTAEVGGISTAFRNSARVYQSYIHQSQFISITQTVQITGMRLRLDQTAVAQTWPSQDLSFANYTVEMSLPSAAIVADGEIAGLTTTFAQNQGAGVTTVRSGAMTIPANSFTATGLGTPNAFGPTINFSTPYTYTPGSPLLYTIYHSGYTPNTEIQRFFAGTSFASGVADTVLLTSSGTGASTPSEFSSPYIVEFVYSSSASAPEPGTLALVALGMAGGAVARRRRK